jgi:hypothetical protein
MATFANDLVTRVPVVFSHNGATAVSTRVDIPENCDLVDVIIDTLVAPAGSTAFNIRVGVTANGTEIASDTNVQAGGRFRPTFTTAQLAAMSPAAPAGGQQVSKTIYVTGTPTGTSSAGQFRVALLATARSLA